MGAAVASLCYNADQRGADSASRVGRRAFARVLFRHLDEVDSVAPRAFSQCNYCALPGGEKTAWPITVAFGVLRRGIPGCGHPRSRHHRRGVRARWSVARFSLLQF